MTIKKKKQRKANASAKSKELYPNAFHLLLGQSTKKTILNSNK